MDAKLQLRVQRYGWDAAASVYHDDWSDQLKTAQDTLLELATLQPRQKVLETACGTGMVTLRAAREVGASGSVFATDLSAKMVNAVAEHCMQANLSNVTVARMGAEALDVGNNAFDVALCSLGLMYVPDPCTALAEMERAVRPGGKVVATVWGERQNCGWADIFPIVDARVASEVCPLFFASGAPGRLRSDFESANMVDIHETRQSEILQFENADNLCRAMMLGGPVALAVKRFDTSVMSDVRSEFLNSVANHRNDDGSYSIPGEFVTVCATIPD
ncbi:MAG: methyltransferase domain-containing protein [Alphaproteobacteria bacterium]|nr:methyltransferase domain-containing protein [Alphaproteobacteria bacterium]